MSLYWEYIFHAQSESAIPTFLHMYSRPSTHISPNESSKRIIGEYNYFSKLYFDIWMGSAELGRPNPRFIYVFNYYLRYAKWEDTNIGGLFCGFYQGFKLELYMVLTQKLSLCATEK